MRGRASAGLLGASVCGSYSHDVGKVGKGGAHQSATCSGQSTRRREAFSRSCAWRSTRRRGLRRLDVDAHIAQLEPGLGSACGNASTRSSSQCALRRWRRTRDARKRRGAKRSQAWPSRCPATPQQRRRVKSLIVPHHHGQVGRSTTGAATIGILRAGVRRSVSISARAAAHRTDYSLLPAWPADWAGVDH